MKLIIILLSAIVVLLIIYIMLMKREINNITIQVDKRISKNTHQLISLSLFNKDLNRLVLKINKCLKAEEKLRLKVIRDEKEFKEMITNISHDLRTPLTAIKGYQEITRKGELDQSQIENLDIAIKYTEDLGKLINDFFEYAYYLNENFNIQLKMINLTNMLTEYLVDSIPLFEKNNIKVNFEQSLPIYILADESLLKRIIQNLIKNCIQHSVGDINIKIEVKEYAIISFENPIKSSDNIDITKIFERFYTADKSRGNSTGLGLSIVRLLAEKMSGSTEAYLKDGSIEIRVLLPLYNNML